MAWDRRSILRTLSDRLAARDHVAAIVGADHLPRILGVVDHPTDLERGRLPREYVLKVTHGSGGSILVADGLARGTGIPDASTLRTWPRLRLHPDDVDPDRADAILARLLGWDFSWRPVKPLTLQWAYRDVPRRVVVEELLRDRDGRLPDDLKVMVSHGRPELIVVERVDGNGQRRTPAFTPDWRRPLGAPPVPDVPRPINLDLALDLARRIAGDLDFLRVDLYDLGDRVLVGETTVYPLGGADPGPAGSFTDFICPGWDPTRVVPRRTTTGPT